MFKIGRKHSTWHVTPRIPKQDLLMRAIQTDTCGMTDCREAEECVADWNPYQDTRAYQVEADRKRAMAVIFANRNVAK